MRLVVFALVCGCSLFGCSKVSNVPESHQIDGVELLYSDARFQVERPIELVLSQVPNGAVVTGHIQGLSMDMGTIPLQFTPTGDGKWQSHFLLGACTEPAMRWQLQLTIEHADGQLQQLVDTFQSSR